MYTASMIVKMKRVTVPFSLNILDFCFLVFLCMLACDLLFPFEHCVCRVMPQKDSKACESVQIFNIWARFLSVTAIKYKI